MLKKVLAAAISVFTFAMVNTPWKVSAMTETTAEIPFTVENYPGTVVIEPIGDAPLNGINEFVNVNDGTFTLSYTEPDQFSYRIYQLPGDLTDVIYDDTVYNVIVSAFVNDDDELYTTTAIGIDGQTGKLEDIVFTNTAVQDEESSSQNEQSSNEGVQGSTQSEIEDSSQEDSSQESSSNESSSNADLSSVPAATPGNPGGSNPLTGILTTGGSVILLAAISAMGVTAYKKERHEDQK